jgi:amidase
MIYSSARPNGVPAVSAVHNPTNPEFYFNGVKVDPENGWVMTYPFCMVNFTPVLAVPSGRASYGVPTGIQLIGRSFDDVSVFRVGLAYEAASPSVFIHSDNHPI